MDKQPTILTCNELKAGDILLCFTKMLAGQFSQAKTSGYVHAAICVSETEMAECMYGGVSKKAINNNSVIKNCDYEHVAVFRKIWSPESLNKLNTFIDNRISSGVKFNHDGLNNIDANISQHAESLHENIEKAFAGTFIPESPIKDSYFCSELIVAAHIEIGFIGEKAATIYNPKTFPPEKLGQELVFGALVGYLICEEGYEIPKTDIFINAPSFAEIFG